MHPFSPQPQDKRLKAGATSSDPSVPATDAQQMLEERTNTSLEQCTVITFALFKPFSEVWKLRIRSRGIYFAKYWNCHLRISEVKRDGKMIRVSKNTNSCFATGWNWIVKIQKGWGKAKGLRQHGREERLPTGHKPRWQQMAFGTKAANTDEEINLSRKVGEFRVGLLRPAHSDTEASCSNILDSRKNPRPGTGTAASKAWLCLLLVELGKSLNAPRTSDPSSMTMEPQPKPVPMRTVQ